MDFSSALLQLKAGKRMTNAHWLPGMFVVRQKGYPDGIPINQNTAEATGLPEGSMHIFRPYYMLHCVDGSFVPYVATQSDLDSEVWGISRITPGTDAARERQERTTGPEINTMD